MATNENPRKSQSGMSGKVGGQKFRREDLRMVAKYQKGIIICILFQIIVMISPWVLPDGLRFAVGMCWFVASIVGLICVILLATKLYAGVTGGLLGVGALIPCVGLIVLLVINGKATAILKGHGIKVGLLGADPSSI